MNKAMDPAAAVLENFLLIQNMLLHLPDEPSVLEFVCRGLRDLPGVQTVRHRVAFPDTAAPADPIPLDERAFNLRFGRAGFGSIVLTFDDAAAFLPYEPYVDNLCSMVAANLAHRQSVTVSREGESHLTQILDGSPAGVSIVSLANKKRVYVNQRFVEMFGDGTDDDLLSMNISESYVDRSRFEDNWVRFEREGSITGAEDMRKRFDGTTWWCLADWRPISFAGKDAVVVWHYDITQRRHAEEELKARTELVDLLRKVASDANTATSFDEAMHTCLATVCNQTGWPVGHVYLRSRDDDERLDPSGIWHLDDTKRFAAFIEATKRTTFAIGVGLPGRVLASGEPAWIVDVTEDDNFLRAKQARDVHLHGAFAFPVLAGGRVIAVLEFFDEKPDAPNETLLSAAVHIGSHLGRVFERQEAESRLRRAMDDVDFANRSLEEKVAARTQELNDAVNEARAANRAKTEFLANMSHELRSPLNAILGFSELIERAIYGPLESQYRDYAGDIHAAGEHLLAIISDILNISKVEAGELVIHEEDVDLAETVSACEMMVRNRAAKGGLTLTTSLPADLPIVRADPLRVKQILLNILGNAIKFTPSGGAVVVDGRVEPDHGVAVLVRDTGPGMAEEDIPRALERFGQICDDHMRAHGGADLDLAVASGLMELHGGTLDIDSRLGEGTTVTISFPANRSKAADDREAARERESGGRPRTV